MTNEKHITSLVWRYNDKLYTKRGITIGSSEEDVQKAYGTGHLYNYTFEEESARVIFYGENSDSTSTNFLEGIQFTIQNNKVVQISIIKKPWDVYEINIISNNKNYWIKP